MALNIIWSYYHNIQFSDTSKCILYLKKLYSNRYSWYTYPVPEWCTYMLRNQIYCNRLITSTVTPFDGNKNCNLKNNIYYNFYKKYEKPWQGLICITCCTNYGTMFDFWDNNSSTGIVCSTSDIRDKIIFVKSSYNVNTINNKLDIIFKRKLTDRFNSMLVLLLQRYNSLNTSLYKKIFHSNIAVQLYTDYIDKLENLDLVFDSICV